MLYFAYGSNTNRLQMANRCPEAMFLGVATCHDYRLVERLFADIEPAPDCTLQGVLWDLTTDCVERLDRYEGLASHLYRRIWVHITLPDGHPERAMSYRMTQKSARSRQGVEFSEQYAAGCAYGYADAGLVVPALYLRRLTVAENTWEN